MNNPSVGNLFTGSECVLQPVFIVENDHMYMECVAKRPTHIAILCSEHVKIQSIDDTTVDAMGVVVQWLDYLALTHEPDVSAPQQRKWHLMWRHRSGHGINYIWHRVLQT